ncbi:Cyclin-like protein [Pseudocohnilembus persalinus]|uniref:Cyclin-like protein n=1 Tax=Pseudocohnilembus persalinus TaxID=266149 RepID=A0A0V0R2C4_PSEPJ|nr:Cyclin-like protein [Pseudocohnilembus persalinus]|eukprot:KRX08325.1 Cyclin-like protein [Pseudocohnilembus persalinus]
MRQNNCNQIKYFFIIYNHQFVFIGLAKNSQYLQNDQKSRKNSLPPIIQTNTIVSQQKDQNNFVNQVLNPDLVTTKKALKVIFQKPVGKNLQQQEENFFESRNSSILTTQESNQQNQFQIKTKKIKKYNKKSQKDNNKEYLNEKREKVWSTIYNVQSQLQHDYQSQKSKSLQQQFEQIFCKPQLNDHSTALQPIDLKNEFFNQSYKDMSDEDYIKDQINLNNFLQNCQINKKQRTRMVDWMVEVFHYYESQASQYSFYRAVELMDHYIMKETQVRKKQVTDKDIHLVGICCMFIASKVQDIIQIPFHDVYEQIGHKKFSTATIKAKESEILTAIDYNVVNPTSFEFLRKYFYEIFSASDQQFIQNLLETASLILTMLLHSDQFRNYLPSEVAFCTLKLALQMQFNNLIEEDDPKLKIPSNIINNAQQSVVKLQIKNANNIIQELILIQCKEKKMNTLKQRDLKQNDNYIQSLFDEINSYVENFAVNLPNSNVTKFYQHQ